MPLIYCEISFIPTWYANCFTVDAPINNQVTTFTITCTKLFKRLYFSYNRLSSTSTSKGLCFDRWMKRF